VKSVILFLALLVSGSAFACEGNITCERMYKVRILQQLAPIAADMRCPHAGPELCEPLSRKKDPLTNPDAVKHQIDRSAMEIQIQGWSRDLKFPVYPLQVQAGGNATYYVTKPSVKQYKEFDFDELRCEIGDAPKEVLKLKDYACDDGVCMTKEGAILGTDPRRPVNKKHRC